MIISAMCINTNVGPLDRVNKCTNVTPRVFIVFPQAIHGQAFGSGYHPFVSNVLLIICNDHSPSTLSHGCGTVSVDETPQGVLWRRENGDKIAREPGACIAIFYLSGHFTCHVGRQFIQAELDLIMGRN